MEQSGYSVTDLYNFLKDIDFPATKQDLINYAEENDVSDVIINRLEKLPDKQYDSLAEVVKSAATSVF